MSADAASMGPGLLPPPGGAIESESSTMDWSTIVDSASVVWSTPGREMDTRGVSKTDKDLQH